MKCDHMKRLITLTSDYIKRVSLYSEISGSAKGSLTLQKNLVQEKKIVTKIYIFKAQLVTL